MNLGPQADAPVDDLAATLLANHQESTPVDRRQRQEAVVAPMPSVGDCVLNRYRIVAWTGLGAASVVFRGEHQELALPVAIKIVNRLEYPERAAAIGHLRNEALILSRLRHANVAHLWDFSEAGPYPSLITEFVAGPTLRHQIQLEGRLGPRRAIRAATHVADALVALGRGGVVHRDIKPENIMLSVDGAAKLIDFGLSIIVGHENPAAHVGLAVPRVGTVAYLAPEQARNAAAIDQRADIYSLGATLYHAVTGRIPFSGNNAAQVVLRHLEDSVVPPRSVVPELPEELSEAIMRMMAKHPCDRFADARELAETLRHIEGRLQE
jgi:serine/threonine protein kinase